MGIQEPLTASGTVKIRPGKLHLLMPGPAELVQISDIIIHFLQVQRKVSPISSPLIIRPYHRSLYI